MTGDGCVFAQSQAMKGITTFLESKEKRKEKVGEAAIITALMV
jgi:hypothetical protein